MKLKFLFIASTLLTILASGSVLMAVFQTAMTPINENAADVAGTWAGAFTNTILLVLIICVVLPIALKRIR